MSYVRVLHAVCAVYLLYLDAHLLPIAYEIITTRQDIVRGHFAGLGLQFYTFWNQLAQQVFTFLVLALDISDVIRLPINKQLKAKLRNLSNDLFMFFVFPSAITVAVNFWMMYAFLENNLIEDFEVIQRHVPPWANQCLHTVILILPAMEILASWKPYPKRMQGLLKSLIVVMCYTVWTIFARIIGGRWPYPFLSMLSPAGLLLYTFGNTTLSSVSYLIGHEFNQAVWGSKQGSIQIYFFAALAYDVIEPWKGHEALRHIKRALRMFKAVFFTSVVIPTAILVAVNYWTLNTLLDPALIEDTQVLQRYVPLWMDHTLHTAVVPFAILELLLAHRPYPRWKTFGRLRSTFVVLSYTSWVVFCVLVGGTWPYPYLQRMTVAQRLIYLLINCALAAWSYSASDVINAAIWGKRCKVV